jgi:hypothetical protein
MRFPAKINAARSSEKVGSVGYGGEGSTARERAAVSGGQPALAVSPGAALRSRTNRSNVFAYTS